MPFCALLQRCPLGIQKYLARPGPPMMDLSSLDGPPIFDTRNAISSGPIDFSSLDGGPVIADPVIFLPPNPTVSCIHEEPPTPQTDAQYHLLSKPLPPRPSTDSSWQRARVVRRTSNADDDATNALGRAPVRRRQASPSEDISLVDEYNHDRSRPAIQVLTNPAASQPRRSHSCDPLVWLEEEGLWEIPSRWPSRTTVPSQHSQRSRRRSSVSTVFSAIPDGWPIHMHHGWPPHQFDTVRVHIDSALGELPPSYDSHAFSPTYVMRMQDGPLAGWSAVSRRVTNVSAN
ncbi:hypothetical protein N7520_011547 [Penicillium odoratum]|uniref:uncharacterized protein n=1 Tax=Penicillium odoratum TaxID=1167516 RepID=UPI002548807C|nr:uncharacterized protein N7520_011547 [Penicillium odoratum]KAJ5746365.1 hypothetical protein N7520_011547 [Penicillium odoratum]